MTPETGAIDVHDRVGLVRIVAEQPEMFLRGFDIHLGLVFGVLRDLKIVQGDGAVLVQILGALQLGARQNFVRHRLAVIGEAAGDIVAANAQQQLTLLHGVAEARVNRHDAAGDQRDDRDAAGDIGSSRCR